jgi:hypothetical protein
LCDGSILELADHLDDVYTSKEDRYQRCGSVGWHQYGQPNDEDTDLGPYQAWRAENATLNVAESFLLGDYWLRDRAYVFWDSGRVQEMGRLRDMLAAAASIDSSV